MKSLKSSALKTAALCLIMLCCYAHAQTADTFTDPRDGKTYRTVKIGEQVWMGENLNYTVSGSYCYDNDPLNCEKYGRLYNWNAAMNSCPTGWHLSTREEWSDLVTIVGLSPHTKLKAGSPDWNGTDDFGFSALPGGESTGINNVSFSGLGQLGQWWTATMSSSSIPYRRIMSTSGTGVNESTGYTTSARLSVRCVQD
jgi:uncharacterized protein (TIGR02145 family)